MKEEVDVNIEIEFAIKITIYLYQKKGSIFFLITSNLILMPQKNKKKIKVKSY